MKTNPVTWIMGSTLMAFISTAVGFVLGAKGKVTEIECKERRLADTMLLTAKLKSLEDRFTSLECKIDLLLKNVLARRLHDHEFDK